MATRHRRCFHRRDQCNACFEIGSLADGREKTVRWFLMHALAETRPPLADVDEVRWLASAQARELLTYPSDKELLALAGL